MFTLWLTGGILGFFVCLFVLVIFNFPLNEFKLLMALDEARRTVLLKLNWTVCSGSPAPPGVRLTCVSEAQ